MKSAFTSNIAGTGLPVWAVVLLSIVAAFAVALLLFFAKVLARYCASKRETKKLEEEWRKRAAQSNVKREEAPGDLPDTTAPAAEVLGKPSEAPNMTRNEYDPERGVYKYPEEPSNVKKEEAPGDLPPTTAPAAEVPGKFSPLGSQARPSEYDPKSGEYKYRRDPSNVKPEGIPGNLSATTAPTAEVPGKFSPLGAQARLYEYDPERGEYKYRGEPK